VESDGSKPKLPSTATHVEVASSIKVNGSKPKASVEMMPSKASIESSDLKPEAPVVIVLYDRERDLKT
jgi:hypothetical protein